MVLLKRTIRIQITPNHPSTTMTRKIKKNNKETIAIPKDIENRRNRC